MFHAISRVFTSCSPGATPIISPPESLNVFPSLAKEIVNGNGNGTPTPSTEEGEDEKREEEFQPVKTKLESDSMFMIAIDENKARLTLAGAVLDSAQQMIDCLAVLAEISRSDS